MGAENVEKNFFKKIFFYNSSPVGLIKNKEAKKSKEKNPKTQGMTESLA